MEIVKRDIRTYLEFSEITLEEPKDKVSQTQNNPKVNGPAKPATRKPKTNPKVAPQTKMDTPTFTAIVPVQSVDAKG